MLYKYETHLHTCEASGCGVSSGADYPEYYKSLGYAGIFITDHFFNGNSGVPRDLPWNERIELFCKGYEKAKEAGDKIGFSVFFGWEDNFEGDEFLVYGLNKQWLLDHPDMLSWSRRKHFEEIKKSGGLVVQAHPFRERDYIKKINLNPTCCDAMEAYNSSNELYQNANAALYCEQNNIFMTAGSDLHRIGNLQDEKMFCMGFDAPLNTAADYVSNILNRVGQVCVAPEYFVKAKKIETKLEVVIHK